MRWITIFFLIHSIGLLSNPEKLILEAIKEKNLAKAEQAISQKLNLKKVIKYEGTYLCHALDEGAMDIARLLVEKGANVNQGDSSGKAPIHCATSATWMLYSQKIEALQFLLEKGANINARWKGEHGFSTPLDLASNYYHGEGGMYESRNLIFLLLEKKAKFNLFQPDDFIGLVNMRYDFEMLQALQKAGYTAKQKPENYENLLTIREPFNEASRFKQLLKHKCKYATVPFCEDVEPFLQENSSHFSSKKFINEVLFFGAIHIGKEEFAIKLLEMDQRLAKMEISSHIFDVPTNQKPICYSATKGLIDLSLELIKKGADPNDRCHGGMQNGPLNLAIKHNKANVLKKLIPKLIKAGAKTRYRSTSGYSPIHFAVLYGDTETLQLIIQADKNWINPMDQDRFTPLTMACRENNYEKALLLVENGARPYLKDRWGGTCAHTIARKPKGKVEILQLMHKSGIDLNEPDGAGNTPMQYAKFGIDHGPNNKAVEYLKSLGISDKVKKPDTTPFNGLPWYGYNAYYGELEYDEN
ncbi:MAG: ankyrin repeat domain-containing protein [Leptospiraceae bacterium]|nr:ankyrin repeat domain-containing protein [Leptospiraceae bacterium]